MKMPNKQVKNMITVQIVCYIPHIFGYRVYKYTENTRNTEMHKS